jgi:putative membrane protein
MMWHGGGMAAWGLFSMIGGPVVLIVVVVLLLWGGLGHRDQASGRDAAERMLAERYARGELTDDEYRQRLRTLRQA